MKQQSALSIVIGTLLSIVTTGHGHAGSKMKETQYQPRVKTSWQWQLMGKPNLEYSVDLYDLDLFDTPATTIKQLQAKNIKVICYFSAGSYEDFRIDSIDFPDESKGAVLEGYDNERWLDIRSPKVMEIMKKRMDLAVEKNCDGVEPDNVDGYANNNGLGLKASDQLRFNRTLAEEAHKRGLSIGLKNDLDQLEELVDHFDFAVNEQCHEYNECGRLTTFTNAGKPVFNAEYKSEYIEDAKLRKTICAQSKKLGIQTLFLPLDLDDEFRLTCGD